MMLINLLIFFKPSIICLGLREWLVYCFNAFFEATKSYEKPRFTDIYENTDKGRYLTTANEHIAKGNTPTAKKYETKDEDFDEEGIENPYGDMYINEETISDIQIRDLGQVIKDKRRNEDDGFKREYAVSFMYSVTVTQTVNTSLRVISFLGVFE